MQVRQQTLLFSNNIFDLDTIVYLRFEILTEFGGSYTINVPYFCYQCGKCCRETVFPDIGALPTIADYFGLSIRELVIQILGNKEITTLPDSIQQISSIKPCVFLKENKCTIYPVRPSICQRWYPRTLYSSGFSTKRTPACPAYSRLTEMCKTFLNDHSYRIGVYEILHVGTSRPESPFPFVKRLEEVQKETLVNYFPPNEENAKRLLEIFLDFNPKKNEKKIFLALNPALRFI
jgi:Fe-S-cluster containining protein